MPILRNTASRLRYPAALALFVGGAVVAARRADLRLEDIDLWSLAVVACVGVPATVALNSVEFALTSRMVGGYVGFSRATEISILSTAANVLPIPGSPLVRIAALRNDGASTGAGTIATTIAAVMWAAAASAVAGVWYAVYGSPLATAVAAVSTSGLVGLAAILGRRVQLTGLHAMQLMLVELATVGIDAARLHWCLQALSLEASFGQASGLAIATVAGSLAGFAPAGLGVRELIASLLSPLVALPPASGFLAMSLNRVTGLSVIGPISAVLARPQRHRKP